jgi:hypothetical protein
VQLQFAAIVLFALAAAHGTPSNAARGASSRAAPAEAAAVARPGAARDRYSALFEEWAGKDARGRAALDLEKVQKELDGSLDVRGSRREPIDVALLELLAACRDDAALGFDRRLETLVRGTLEERFAGRGGSGFDDFLLGEVLPSGSKHSAAVRAGACAACAGQRRLIALDALAAATSADDERVRREARRVLVGALDTRASRALLAACEVATGREGAAARADLAAHLEIVAASTSSASAWTSDLAVRLPRAVLPALVDGDWRAASRAVPLARHCDFEVAAPRCIEALHTWARREDTATDARALVGMRRVMFEIAALLEEGSGTKLGVEPVRWTQWWRSRRGGAEAPRPVQRTVTGAFFGLDVRSGAVAFVIDASGSMDYPLPSRTTRPSEETRFEEAVQQLDRVLGSLHEPATFQVVLFSDEGRRFSDGARLVDEHSRESVRTWLERNGPGGGTRLCSGLDLLVAGRDASDAALDFDTVVVLCDGETEEGADWARQWLAEHDPDRALVFHCIQIGTGAASALEELARSTGGRFVRAP